jgi:hypothetical protein
MDTPILDPIKFVELCWPDIHLYGTQRDILYSLRDNDETFAVAGNQLGKDFVTAIAVLWYFASRRPCKIVTTSVQASQLNDVLWGEIRRLFDSAKIALPFRYNHFKIRQIRSDGSIVGNSELVGQVINQGEALLGRHLARGAGGEPRTLAVFDEASGIDSSVYESTDTWAHRKLIIGNPYPCTNFFYSGVKAGDLPRKNGKGGYHRKVFRIRAQDSPNVKLAFKEIREGKQPSGRIIIPGVVDYDTYTLRRATWPAVRQSIGLDAQFWEGADTLFYPPAWLDEAERRHELISAPRKVTHIGVDPAEGGDFSCWAMIDDLGLVDLIKIQTEDTTEVVDKTLDLIKETRVRPENVLFDRGGGGKEHADRLRRDGFNVRTVAFGESVKNENITNTKKPNKQRREEQEEAYVYKNRRAEMYGLLRSRLSPFSMNPLALPRRFVELRRQLSLLPLLFDGEGRVYLPPKNKKKPNSKEQTLQDILGCSPDEADALVLANYGASKKVTKIKVG